MINAGEFRQLPIEFCAKSTSNFLQCTESPAKAGWEEMNVEHRMKTKYQV